MLQCVEAEEPTTYVRVNPEVKIEQLEEVLKQTEMTVYATKEKRQLVTQGIVKTGMYITSKEEPEGKEIAVRGDVNGDGKANQVDLSYLIRYIIGINGTALEGVQYEAGDFKKDGEVNQIDLSHIIRYIVFGVLEEETEIPELKVPNAEGNITVSEVTWNGNGSKEQEGTAKLTIQNTTDSYTMEYQVVRKRKYNRCKSMATSIYQNARNRGIASSR